MEQQYLFSLPLAFRRLGAQDSKTDPVTQSTTPAAAAFPAPPCSGREDIDVRMLGQGRPFILEIHKARRRVPPPHQLQQLEAGVAEVGQRGAECVVSEKTWQRCVHRREEPCMPEGLPQAGAASSTPSCNMAVLPPASRVHARLSAAAPSSMHAPEPPAWPLLGLQASHGGVAVCSLFAASPSQLALLKQGEQEKQKSYVAVGTKPWSGGSASQCTCCRTVSLPRAAGAALRVLSSSSTSAAARRPLCRSVGCRAR